MLDDQLGTIFNSHIPASFKERRMYWMNVVGEFFLRVPVIRGGLAFFACKDFNEL